MASTKVSPSTGSNIVSFSATLRPPVFRRLDVPFLRSHGLDQALVSIGPRSLLPLPRRTPRDLPRAMVAIITVMLVLERLKRAQVGDDVRSIARIRNADVHRGTLNRSPRVSEEAVEGF